VSRTEAEHRRNGGNHDRFPEVPVRFRDRSDAGRRLAERLEELRGQDVVVLGLPRGGVPVAAEVARSLSVPLDVIVVRKVGVPFRPELAMGAVGEGGVLVVDERVVALTGVTPEDLAEAARRERLELDTQVARFRGNRPPVPLAGRAAVLVDDGIATGSTARAACAVARALGATRVVLAAPVCPRAGLRQLAADVDELICLVTPRDFVAVGQFYADFRATRDEEVLELLGRARMARWAGDHAT
jgi:putative phosphoribosyl transferase